MLYFIYQFLQGIAPVVFTAVDCAQNGILFITTGLVDLKESFSNIDFPPLVLAVLEIVLGLGLFDKVVHLLKG